MNRRQRSPGSWVTLVVIGRLVILMGVIFVVFRPLVT
jgi:hypothetical protein